MNVKDPNSSLMRWRLKLEEFEYEIVYKLGKTNTNANALSRISDNAIDSYYKQRHSTHAFGFSQNETY